MTSFSDLGLSAVIPVGGRSNRNQYVVGYRIASPAPLRLTLMFIVNAIGLPHPDGGSPSCQTLVLAGNCRSTTDAFPGMPNLSLK